MSRLRSNKKPTLPNPRIEIIAFQQKKNDTTQKFKKKKSTVHNTSIRNRNTR